MNTKICLFHDYLSDISPREKVGMLGEMRAKVIDQVEISSINHEKRLFGATSNVRRQYRDIVMETKRHFGRYAPNALAAMMVV